MTLFDYILQYLKISDNIQQYLSIFEKSRDLTISDNIRQNWAVIDKVGQ